MILWWVVVVVMDGLIHGGVGRNFTVTITVVMVVTTSTSTTTSKDTTTHIRMMVMSG